MQKVVKKRVLRRLATVAGQVRGVERMVEREAYCMDIITQIAATRQALSAIDDAVLAGHLATCVVRQMKGAGRGRAVRELLAAYAASKKK